MAENPPAFPLPDAAAYQYPGMSLRDWFAGQAIQATWMAYDAGYFTSDNPNADIAAAAYQLADAMIAARSKP